MSPRGGAVRLRGAGAPITRIDLPAPLPSMPALGVRSPICSSPTPTACPSSTAASGAASICRRQSCCNPPAASTRHRSRRQPLLRPHRLLRRQPVRLRLLQASASSAAQPRVAELGPVLGAYHPVIAYNVRRLREISGPRRGVVPHVGHRGGDAGGAAGALPHRRRTHLVRFCGAYHGWWGDVQPGIGQPACRRARPTRCKDMYRGIAAGAAQRARHRLRAGQSAAGAASERQRAARFRAGRQRAARADFDRAAYAEWLQRLARCLHRARHRADF